MILTAIVIIVVLGVLIFVHEFGHFLTAKKTGVKVEEFGFGFPPRIFGLVRYSGQKLEKVAETERLKVDIQDYQLNNDTELIKETVTDEKKEIDRIIPTKKWKFFWGKNQPVEQVELKTGTIYSFNWIPLGGFVKIKGEQGDQKNDQDSFANKKIWQRSLILSSGVLMNFVLTMVILSIGFFIGFPSVITDDLNATIKDKKIQIVSLLEKSPAEIAGLQIGDTIKAIDGQTFKTIDELQRYNNPKINQEITVTINRDNQIIEKKIILAALDETKLGKMGASLVETGIISYPWYKAIGEGVKATFYITWQIILAFYDLFKNLIVSRTVPTDIAGPVGIAVITAKVSRLGFIYILQFAAILSINLAILNFLPFPALDGGRVLFLIIEKIRGKAVDQKIESLIHNIGFFILIGLVLLVTLRDVSRFKESIMGFLKNIIS